MKFQLTSDLVQVEEEEGVELERLDLEAGEHFTIVTSKGRVRAEIKFDQNFYRYIRCLGPNLWKVASPR